MILHLGEKIMAKKTEFKIGEEVQFGLVRARVTATDKVGQERCVGCVLRSVCKAVIESKVIAFMDPFIGRCGLGRSDGEFIVFKEIE